MPLRGVPDRLQRRASYVEEMYKRGNAGMSMQVRGVFGGGKVEMWMVKRKTEKLSNIEAAKRLLKEATDKE